MCCNFFFFPVGECDGQCGDALGWELAPTSRRAALPGSAIYLYGAEGFPYKQSSQPGFQKEYVCMTAFTCEKN